MCFIRMANFLDISKSHVQFEIKITPLFSIRNPYAIETNTTLINFSEVVWIYFSSDDCVFVKYVKL